MMLPSSLPDVLRDYCAIFRDIPAWKRKERHGRFQTWIAAEYALPSYTEVMAFLTWLDGQNEVPVNTAFQLKVIFPVFDVEIFSHGNAQAMKLMLFRFDSGLFQEYKKDSSLDLLRMALERLPDDPELLDMSWQRQRDYYAYTIHELPSGILFDADGASIEATQENLTDLEAFAALCLRLGRNEHILLRACREYYTLWIAYLSEREAYRDFADYLIKHRNALSAGSIACVFGMRELFGGGESRDAK